MDPEFPVCACFYVAGLWIYREIYVQLSRQSQYPPPCFINVPDKPWLKGGSHGMEVSQMLRAPL